GLRFARCYAVLLPTTCFLIAHVKQVLLVTTPMSINGWCNNMRFRSEHTRECLTFVCEDAPVLTGNAGLQYVAKVKEVLSNIQSRRDVVLDLADVVVVSLNVVEQLICLKAALADENRNLVLINLRPLVAEMLQNISAGDLLKAGQTASEEPSVLCASEASL
ncbi:MAG: STAS domain-containing protein, partial [Planctomycetales bacterium]